jgi:hypothetical protein
MKDKTLEDLKTLREQVPHLMTASAWFANKVGICETLIKNKMHASANHVFAQLQGLAKKG